MSVNRRIAALDTPRGRRRSCAHTSTHRPTAFSLIELLVVVATVALLVAILLPALTRARKQTQALVCLSNLHQLVVAADSYTHTNQDRYPIAYIYTAQESGLLVSYAWDFTAKMDWATGMTTVTPGLLWPGGTNPRVQQCPSCTKPANWLRDPHTGYNYNTSYIGHGDNESIREPARRCEVRNPAGCALFGDGEYAGGANKFMRAPWRNPGDENFSGRSAGTQGYRHLGRTNVAFCDGHAQPWRPCWRETYPSDQPKIAPGTGFLSPDNSMYDLK